MLGRVGAGWWPYYDRQRVFQKAGQTDGRYQAFLKGAKTKNVLGYQLPVACIEDIFQGKVWAASDEKRRPSKRQKDLADILRLMEVKTELKKLLPEKLKKRLRV